MTLKIILECVAGLIIIFCGVLFRCRLTGITFRQFMHYNWTDLLVVAGSMAMTIVVVNIFILE